jgi:hypothetical protein
MPEIIVRLDVPDELACELERASRECEISPAQFCAQSIEVMLASRRLPSVAAGKMGARMIGEPLRGRIAATMRESEEPRVLSAGEIPTLYDVEDSLADIR